MTRVIGNADWQFWIRNLKAGLVYRGDRVGLSTRKNRLTFKPESHLRTRNDPAAIPVWPTLTGGTYSLKQERIIANTPIRGQTQRRCFGVVRSNDTTSRENFQSESVKKPTVSPSLAFRVLCTIKSPSILKNRRFATPKARRAMRSAIFIPCGIWCAKTSRFGSSEHWVTTM